MSEKRVVVLMPPDMVEFIEAKSKETGVGNVSSFVRMVMRQMMKEEVRERA